MKINIRFLIIAIWVLNPVLSKGQVIPVNPLSDTVLGLQNPLTATQYLLPSYNNDSLLIRYNTFTDSIPHPLYFAFGMPQEINIKDAEMNWVLHDTFKVLRLGFFSDSALGFKFRFDSVEIPKGAFMYIYPPNREKIYGAYSYLNNRIDNTFITQEIPYNYLIMEWNVPINVFGQISTIIDEIAYVYQSDYRTTKFNGVAYGKSQDTCHVNTICYPYEGEWCNEIRAAVKLELPKTNHPTNHAYEPEKSHYVRCSGVLLNNSRNDFTGYIASALHCIDDNVGEAFDYAPYAHNAVITYNWTSPSCRPTKMGNDQMTQVGLQVIDKRGKKHNPFCGWTTYCPDQVLFKLLDTMRLDYNTYYAGWNKSTTQDDFEDDYVAAVHHPVGDVKKIAKGVLTRDKIGNSCYETDCYEVGFFAGGIQKGSSGGPLYASDHKVIGLVSRGGNIYDYRDPLCTMAGPVGGTLTGFGKFGEAYDMYQPFLSPDNNDLHYQNGADPIGACQEDVSIYGRLYPGNDWQSQNQITIQASDELVLAPDGIPTLINGSGILNSTVKADYVFQAENKVTINRNFSIKYGNAMQVKIASCIDFEGCGFNSIAFVAKPEILSTNPLINNANKIKVYPNPTNQTLNIEFPESYRYEIIDIAGKIILSGVSAENSALKSIDLSGFINGVYVLTITNDNTTFTHKILKQ